MDADDARGCFPHYAGPSSPANATENDAVADYDDVDDELVAGTPPGLQDCPVLPGHYGSEVSSTPRQVSKLGVAGLAMVSPPHATTQPGVELPEATGVCQCPGPLVELCSAGQGRQCRSRRITSQTGAPASSPLVAQRGIDRSSGHP